MTKLKELVVSDKRLFIPNLLTPRMLFFLVVAGLLLGLFGWALNADMTWRHSVYTSLFALWVVLVYSIVIHALSSFFARTPILFSVICVFALGITTTVCVLHIMNMVFSNAPSPDYLLPRRIAIVILCLGVYLRYTALHSAEPAPSAPGRVRASLKNSSASITHSSAFSFQQHEYHCQFDSF